MHGRTEGSSDRQGAAVAAGGAAGQQPTVPATASAAREALRAAVGQLDQAEVAGCPGKLTLALARVGACYHAIGALAAAEESLRQALRSARTAGSAQLLVGVLCQLAETACTIAEQRRHADPAGARAARERARDEAFEASSLVLRSIGADWAVAALLRIGDVLVRCGDHEDAELLQVRALEAAGRDTARN